MVRRSRHNHDQPCFNLVSNLLVRNGIRWVYDECVAELTEGIKEVKTKICLDGLQSLDEWNNFFNQPGASILALYA